jgi:hypothetical protein
LNFNKAYASSPQEFIVVAYLPKPSVNSFEFFSSSFHSIDHLFNKIFALVPQFLPSNIS